MSIHYYWQNDDQPQPEPPEHLYDVPTRIRFITVRDESSKAERLQLRFA